MASVFGRLAAVISPATRLRDAIERAKAGDAASVFPVFSAAADRGNSDGQFWVGKAYLDGKGVPPSRNTASFWLEKAATSGHVDAQATLATVYLTGAGRAVDMAPGSPLFSDVDRGEPDFDRALKFGLQAAEAGHAEAQALLGYVYVSGPERIRDVEESDRWYRAAAEAGCAQGSLGHGLALMRTAVAETQQKAATAQLQRAAAARLPLGLYLFGVALENGVGIAQDLEGAADHFRQAAERGVRQGQAKWGLSLMEGRGVARDTTNGESWLRRAALAGDAEAAALVGDLYAKGGELPPNFAEAALWYTRAAEGGHAAAARTLATLYKSGAGVPRDENEAARWFRISGERGDKLARSGLADVVLRGGGQQEDRVRTREWFADAANEGDLVAAFNYGVCLAEGVGIKRDLAAAAQWLRRAADGVVNAQFWYGRMLAEGHGVPVDVQGGREWIKRAADAGLIEAQVALAEMMINGRGGPRDHEAAKLLFEAAAVRDHPGAQFAMGALLGGGHDVPTDRPAAQGWFTKAAASNHPFALLMLGRYLARGLAGKVDRVAAEAMLRRALAAGVAEAANDIAALPPLPTPAPPTPGSPNSATRLTKTPALHAWTRAQQASAAGQAGEAVRWLGRAHRLLPDDKLVALTLGSQLLTCGDPARAVALLTPLAHRDRVPSAWMALASAHLALGAVDPAASAAEQALRQVVVTAELAALASRVVALSKACGWCGLGDDGRLQTGPGEPASLLLDGRAVRPADRLDDGDSLVVTGAGGPFLGSPLPLGRLRALEGFVAETGGGLRGWAWHPASPDRAPTLTVRGPSGVRMITADALVNGIEDLPPLARPRGFSVAAATLTQLGSPVAVTDAIGRHLLGSPIWLSKPPDRLEPAQPRVDERHRETDIVVPVYGNVDDALACLSAVLASIPAATVVYVVDDASPDPECAAALEELARTGRIRLHRHPENRGFPAAVNTGLRAAAGRDVVVLNSDALVPPGWLERLRAAAYAAPEIGTATPLSNDGTIVSYSGAGTPGQLDEVAARANAGLVADLPVGVGFCLYLRRDCLDQVGPLREDLFAQGYGEESDFCLRARQCGWRHVAALDVFVAHQGGRSFGAGRTDLRRRNQVILERHHPGYAAMVEAHLAADPLFEARRRMDALRWARGREQNAVVLVSHGEGGGVAELVAARAGSLGADGVRPVVLVPAAGGCRIEGYDDLRFAVPDELPALAALLRDDQPTHLEVHHLLGHQHPVLSLAALLGIPMESWVHDAASFCPRIALIGRERRYCGEPPVAACEVCVAELGSNLEEPIAVGDLVARSAMDFAGSRRVVVPTADTARRIRRHFPAVRPDIVPWEDDRALPPLDPAPGEATMRVCVVGAIGVEKGYDVLLGCASDARRRGLALEFVVCGITEDDERLMAAGPVFVTGRYDPAEAVELIRAQRAQLVFIPSIWPETWCFALSRAWQAGLPAVAFDLGAQAERIRATGRGQLLPLGLPVARINDALLRLAPASAGLQPWREM